MNELNVQDIRYVDVAGTDAILQLIRKPRKNAVEISALSKKRLTEHSNLHALANGMIMSGMLGLWTIFFTSIAAPMVALLVLAGIPIFSILSMALHNFLITKKDFTEGGREQDKKIYEQDASTMPIIQFEADLFNKPVHEIIDTYNEAYTNMTGKKIPAQKSSYDPQEYGDMLGQDRSFTKIFYDEDIKENSTKDETTEKEVKEIVEELNNANISDSNNFKESVETEHINVVDKRSGNRDSYYS